VRRFIYYHNRHIIHSMHRSVRAFFDKKSLKRLKMCWFVALVLLLVVFLAFSLMLLAMFIA
jgi:hypothetical protein